MNSNNENERIMTQNLMHMIDEATPYRSGEKSVYGRMKDKSGPKTAMYSFLFTVFLVFIVVAVRNIGG